MYNANKIFSIMDQFFANLTEEEAAKAADKLPKERVFNISLFEKLKSAENSLIAAEMLLLHKSAESLEQPCSQCGIRLLCSHWLERKRTPPRCVAGIRKELNKTFHWGETFFEYNDKYEVEDSE